MGLVVAGSAVGGRVGGWVGGRVVFSVCNGAGCMDAPLCPTGATTDPTGAPLDPTGASLDPTGVRDRVWSGSGLGRGLGLPGTTWS